MPPVIAVVGASNSGKTTLIERLIPLFARRGLRVGTLKHDAHRFEMDHPGKDTWRHREAGAEGVLIANASQLALIRSIDALPDPRELIARYLGDMDLVIVEGYKRFGFPQIEVVRAANSQTPLCPPERLCGIVSDLALDFPGVPRFGLDAIEAIADHLLAVAVVPCAAGQGPR